ncbi:hypothetical protein DFR56_10793 [Pseudogracilibacillus auburnensis]|uniref:Uncharacterized protein n=1 Tax=Pseudogracilibacillus auburnensis TaxID=1494959 RepID=A0A2V3W059_9BACI|nr:hypothetical protein DFR56_10793 [Pseudogracilibacillus auburnensis]
MIKIKYVNRHTQYVSVSFLLWIITFLMEIKGVFLK